MNQIKREDIDPEKHIVVDRKVYDALVEIARSYADIMEAEYSDAEEQKRVLAIIAEARP